jgi:NADH-quinone oxidoreductase subunit J
VSAFLLAQQVTEAAGTVSTGEAVAFWILAPLSLLGAIGMLFARNAVHSALFLVLTMLSLGVLYMVQQAPFLGFVQIIVYTGAIMMLFLFVLMLVGRDSSDSVVEVLRGQRLAASLLGVGFAALVAASLARALNDVTPIGLVTPNTTDGGNVANIGVALFTDYLFPFELTSALLITAAVGAMVLAFTDRHARGTKKTQRELVEERFRGDRPGSLPGPGVFATANSVATPALLPDGSIAEESLSAIVETTAMERLSGDVRDAAGTGERPTARALTGARADENADAPAEGTATKEGEE